MHFGRPLVLARMHGVFLCLSLLLSLTFLVVNATTVRAQNAVPAGTRLASTSMPDFKEAREVQKILGQPAERIDLGQIKLTIDKMIDPSSYGRLVRKHFTVKYPTPDQIPESLRREYEYLAMSNRMWFANAEALGWLEPTVSEEEQYLQRIKQTRQQKTAN